MTDERLAQAYQQALAARASPERTGCVTPEALLALARRVGPEAERLATLDHVMACAACKGELELLLAVERAAEQLGVAQGDRRAGGSLADPVPLRPRGGRAGRGRLVALALAASALVALGVGLIGRSPIEPPDVTRGDARAVVATQPAAGETVGLPVTFAWRPVPGASRYTVEVVASDGRVVWSSETTNPTATLSDARVLTPGADYRWSVRVNGGPEHQSRSEPRLLRVRGG